MTKSPGARRGPIPFDEASANVFWFAGACALTIAGTRAYLVLTGYPQVGGAVYHIAHALWGGLLLTIAAIIAVALANHWVPRVVALMGGAGAGLFVDEVGKFITKTNDYFFPLAASIVYLFLVLLALASIALGRRSNNSARAHIYAASGLLARASDGALDSGAQERLVEHLRRADALATTEEQRRVISAMRAVEVVPVAGEQHRVPLTEGIATGLGATTLRRITRTLLLLQSIIGLVLFLAGIVSVVTHVPLLPADIAGVTVGDLAASLTLASVVITVIASALAFSAFRAMSPARLDASKAVRRGAMAMGLLLAVANTLGAYTNQFEVLLDAGVQVVTLGVLQLWAIAETEQGKLRQQGSAADGVR